MSEGPAGTRTGPRVFTEGPDHAVQRWEAPDVHAPVRPGNAAPAGTGSAGIGPPGTAKVGAGRPGTGVAGAGSAGKPDAGAAGGVAAAAPSPLTVQQIERIQKEAREEGFRQGEAEGRKSGAKAVRAQADALQRVLQSLIPSVDGLDQQVEQELVSLAITVARQLVRRELRMDPGQVVAAVRAAVDTLPSTDRKIRLHLHPEDARLVREALHLSELEQPWQLIEDPTFSRGGARVETDTCRVDATVESRLNAVIAELWGGDRREDDEEAGADTGDGGGVRSTSGSGSGTRGSGNSG